MKNYHYLYTRYEDHMKRQIQRLRWYSLHLDPFVILGIMTLNLLGSVVLYSASNENMMTILHQQAHFIVGIICMLLAAQIPGSSYKTAAKWLYISSIILISGVLILGKLSGGAQRWLSLGFFSIQPSELMKFIIPMTLASYLSEIHLPPNAKSLTICFVIIAIPCFIILIEPDLGTAMVVGISCLIMLNIAGLARKVYGWGLLALTVSTPLLWHALHGYQKQRILTFLNPQRQPLGAGYHIIQSEIAIGSGSWLGKGWLQGTQSHLQFLPTHTTDFIFSVLGEEFGLVGALLLLSIYIIIWLRCIYLSWHIQDTFSRLLAAGLAFSCLLGAMINIGMTIGIVPVVGIPLTLVSYGGSSMIINLLIFGIIMALTTQRRAPNQGSLIQ